MSVWIYFLIMILFFLIYGIIYKIAKKKKPFKRAFLVMMSGFIGLLLTDVLGIFTGVYLPISMLSVTVSACGGLPSVAAMIVISGVI